jgi:predicted alpha-1,2-mannosidase
MLGKRELQPLAPGGAPPQAALEEGAPVFQTVSSLRGGCRAIQPGPALAARLALVAFVALTLGGAPKALAAGDPASFVNPFVGTGGDAGHTFPGVVLPFGMVQFSPVSAKTDLSPGGYRYDDLTVRGFALTRLSGAGCPNQGSVPIMPLRAPFKQYPNGLAAGFLHRRESAAPGRYQVQLSNGIGVYLSATARTGFATFRFPERTGVLAFDIGGGATDQSGVKVEAAGKNELRGSVTNEGFCGGPASSTTHFVARFERPIKSIASWGEDGRVEDGVPARQAINTGGAVVSFDLGANRTLRVKVGISYVSVANAARNLDAESRGWSGDAVAARARAAWNQRLGAIRVDGGSPVQRRTFATALYHSLIHPSVSSDVNGQYLGRDGIVHRARGYTRYTNISGWDTYRTQMPLLALLAPRVASDVARSLVEGAKESGSLAKWEIGGVESGIMVGDPAPLLIAGAWAFGARRFDTGAALSAMVRTATVARPGPFVYPSHEAPAADAGKWGAFVGRPGLTDYLARGYVPFDQDAGFIWGPAATTLEYGLSDFAIGRFARATGHADQAAPFARRSGNWRRLFNPATRFIEPRRADGSFPTPFSRTLEDGFVEGNATQYTWFVPQDVLGLTRLLGGSRAALARLDRFHADLDSSHLAPHAWLGNEPSFGTPWLYLWLGEPWRTQAVVRRAVNTLFHPWPAGLPGDDDLGALSSWYVWSALGLYPAVPGVGGLAVGSPLFPSVTIRSSFGVLRIDAPGAGAGSPYVHALRLDGREYAKTWLPVSALRGARTLRFELGSQPARGWATTAAARPPSFPRG